MIDWWWLLIVLPIGIAAGAMIGLGWLAYNVMKDW